MSMLRLRSISIFFWSLTAGVLLSSLPAPAASEPPWIEVHSTHFTVITDAGEKRGKEVALRFEQMRAVFAILLTKDRLNQPLPMTILAFKNDKDYYQLAPLTHVVGQAQGQPTNVPGFFLPGEDQNFIALNLFEPGPWLAVAHDFAHMLLDDNYPPAQGWFDEGLAEYFSSIRVDDKRVEIGGDPELHASTTTDLLDNQHETHPPKSLTELLGAQVWLSLPDLFTMKHDTSADKPGHNEGTHHTLYYAESWMVMHYLLHEKKLPETGTYFDLVLNQHLPVEDAVQKAYGVSSTQLEQAVKDYFHGQTKLGVALDAARLKTSDPAAANSAQPYQFPAPVGPDDVAITSKPLPEADARALYAEIEIRIPDRREAGLKELHALATTPPTAAAKKSETKKEATEAKTSGDDPNEQLTPATSGNALAHRVLAWDHIQHSEFDDAVTELSDAATLNQRDMWVRYYLSVLKFRIAQSKKTDIQGLPNMMQDLKAVLEWYPEFADAYDLLALARNEGGGPTAAMQSERAAMMLSPRNETYVYHLAQIYIASKKYDAAEALLDRLKNSSNPQLASLARERLTQAGAERKYGIPIALAAMQPKLAPQKSPFDVLEEDAAKRAAEEKAAQTGGPEDKRPTKFVKGRLINVDCSTAPVAVITVTAEGAVLKLRAVDYKSLVLIGADDFSCNWRDRQVTVNYKPGGLIDGDLVSLELR
jgi:tetratricopeptide (TPR) repeat protein